MSSSNFFSELPWRNVYELAAAYAVVGWLLVHPLLMSLHGDPRFEALAEKIIPAREFGPDQGSK